jgi:dUTP pyrophosphatase
MTVLKNIPTYEYSYNLPINIQLTSSYAKPPVYSSEGAAGFDFFAIHDAIIKVGRPQIVDTGIKIEVPTGYVLLLFSRSGHGFKNDIRLANAVGVLDSDYRGNVMFKLTKDPTEKDEKYLQIFRGDRIGQGIILPYPKISFVTVDELSSTDRGGNGFGSTGS